MTHKSGGQINQCCRRRLWTNAPQPKLHLRGAVKRSITDYAMRDDEPQEGEQVPHISSERVRNLTASVAGWFSISKISLLPIE